MTDLAQVFDAHVQAEFQDLDLEATMATMSEDPYVHHVPTMTGGDGTAGVRDFYANHFIGQWPDDTTTEPLSRTVGADQVVDELLISFTHDRELEIMLPGVPPTGRRIEIPVVVVVGFEHGKVHHEHIYWDQASVLVQAGLLDPETVPATGARADRSAEGPQAAEERVASAALRDRDRPARRHAITSILGACGGGFTGSVGGRSSPWPACSASPSARTRRPPPPRRSV